MKILEIITEVELPGSNYFARKAAEKAVAKKAAERAAEQAAASKLADQLTKDLIASNPDLAKKIPGWIEQYSQEVVKASQEGRQPKNVLQTIPGIGTVFRNSDDLKKLEQIGKSKAASEIEAAKATGTGPKEKVDKDKKVGDVGGLNKAWETYAKWTRSPDRGYLANILNVGTAGYVFSQNYTLYSNERVTNEANMKIMLQELEEKTKAWEQGGKKGSAPSIKFDYKNSAWPPAPGHPTVYQGDEHDYATEYDRIAMYTVYMNEQARNKFIQRIATQWAAIGLGNIFLKASTSVLAWRWFKDLLGASAGKIIAKHPGVNPTEFGAAWKVLKIAPTYEQFKLAGTAGVATAMNLAEAYWIYKFQEGMNSEEFANLLAGTTWSNVEGLKDAASQIGTYALNTLSNAALVPKALVALDNAYKEHVAHPIIDEPGKDAEPTDNKKTSAVTTSNAPETQPSASSNPAKQDAEDDYDDLVGNNGEPISRSNPPKGQGWALNANKTAWTKPGGFYVTIPLQ